VSASFPEYDPLDESVYFLHNSGRGVAAPEDHCLTWSWNAALPSESAFAFAVSTIAFSSASGGKGRVALTLSVQFKAVVAILSVLITVVLANHMVGDSLQSTPPRGPVVYLLFSLFVLLILVYLPFTIFAYVLTLPLNKSFKMTAVLICIPVLLGVQVMILPWVLLGLAKSLGYHPVLTLMIFVGGYLYLLNCTERRWPSQNVFIRHLIVLGALYICSPIYFVLALHEVPPSLTGTH
jgi:hypothetical protein